jgi:hypothetical protein
MGAGPLAALPSDLGENLSTSDNSHANEIRSYLSRLFKPGELIEYRALLWGSGGRGLYFTDLNRLSEVVAKIDQDPRVQSSYVVINPLKGRLIRERQLIVNPNDEQVEQAISGPGGQTASNTDVDRLTKIFIDCDTIRAPHLKETDPKEYERLQKEPATDEEKAKSKEVAQAVLAYLTELGWPSPYICDSGNGYHLLYDINLTNTATNWNIHGDCLKALKAKFDCETTHIDSTVYNPARLTRAYGSTTRKTQSADHTDTPERPFRRNRIYEPKVPPQEVSLDLLLALAHDVTGVKHNDGDMPELAEGFDPNDWITHYEDQGAFTIQGEKEWCGNPILATDFCLYAQRKHSGDEYKSGFVIGDTFGYKCFSDECEGHTIKDIFAWLREAKNEDGSKRFVDYDKDVYKTETFEELKEAFGIIDLDELDKEHDAEVAAHSIDAPEPEPAVEPGEEGTKKRLKIGRITDLVGWMISAILRDPVGTLPQFRLRKAHIETSAKEHIEVEKTQIWMIDSPMREALTCILGYFEDLSMLPNKGELLNWMDESSHAVARKVRKKDHFSDIRAYVVDHQDDPTKEFAPMAAELDRAVSLYSTKLTTKKNYDKYLKPDSEEDEQAFTIAQRKHAQRKLYSQGDILGKPLQMMTETISEEFRKDVDGVNDIGKLLLGFPPIDEHSHIGLNGERAICIYGPANVGKTTFLMTCAVNMAMSGKNVLVLIGEHQAIPMMKTLTLMLGSFVKDDPEIGVLPDRDAWEGINRTATIEDWEHIHKLLEKLRERLILPGWLGVENISAITQADEDRFGACVDFIHFFHMTYPLDAVIIDPLEQVMSLNAWGKDGAPGEGVKILQQIYNLSRNFEGRSGKGLVIITSVQFHSKMQREIEKQQAKTAIGDNMDDVVLSLMEQTSQVQFFTKAHEILDMLIGIVTRVKRGTEGYLVGGRARFGSTFKNMQFVMDPIAHIITPKGPATYVAPNAKAATAPDSGAVEQSMEPYDVL